MNKIFYKNKYLYRNPWLQEQLKVTPHSHEMQPLEPHLVSEQRHVLKPQLVFAHVFLFI